jgi:acyl-CoA synthetase (AMP-forming)/AMP-acid ligase II
MEAFRARFTGFGLPDAAIQVCYAMAEYVFAVTQTDGPPRVLELDPELFAAEHRAVRKTNGRQVVSVGRQIPGAEIHIENGLQDGQVGEVFVRGDSLCSGYFRAPEITADKFVDGWYRTGDLGFLYDRELYITGRRDDIIIVRGKNLYAHDVELLATDTGMVRAGRVVAFGVEDEGLGTDKLVIVAEVGPQADKKLSTRAVRVAVRETYGLSPADVLLVPPDTLVKTSSGKISRSENRRRYLAGELKPWRSTEKAGAA